jgi:hypothetical protein
MLCMNQQLHAVMILYINKILLVCRMICKLISSVILWETRVCIKLGEGVA